MHNDNLYTHIVCNKTCHMVGDGQSQWVKAMENWPRLPYSSQVTGSFWCIWSYYHDRQSSNACTGILAQALCGLVRICQTNTKELTYLAHVRAPNIFHLEFHRDLSLFLLDLAYALHHLVESLLTITSITTDRVMDRSITKWIDDNQWNITSKSVT